MISEPEVKWSADQMIEVTLNEPDDFLKVRETLTRIGVASRKEKKSISPVIFCTSRDDITLYTLRNCLPLDGKHANLTVNDVQRRNRIIQLLCDWGLVTVINPEKVTDIAPLNQIKVLAYKEKNEWILETKYNIGKKEKSRSNRIKK